MLPEIGVVVAPVLRDLLRHPWGKGKGVVITSYSIHYTKLYDAVAAAAQPGIVDAFFVDHRFEDVVDAGNPSGIVMVAFAHEKVRITSYNVCYTKLLRFLPWKGWLRARAARFAHPEVVSLRSRRHVPFSTLPKPAVR